MKTDKICQKYRGWLIRKAVNWLKPYGNYKNLCEYLYSRTFYSIVDYDTNREEDGLDLRMQFAEQSGYTYHDIYLSDLHTLQCNVLEMMVALAQRCEDYIMTDTRYGERYGAWLFEMLTSMELTDMIDGYFLEDHAKRAVDTMLNREYDEHGHGGLYSIKNPPGNMRTTELWLQMHWYLNELS